MLALTACVCALTSTAATTRSALPSVIRAGTPTTLHQRSSLITASPSLSRRSVCLLSASESSPSKPATTPFANAVGWLMVVGAGALYVPILITLVSSRSAVGFSRLTWAMQLCGFAAFLVYPVRAGFPRSSYFEYTCLLAQSLVINCLLRLYSGANPATVLAAALSFLAVLGAALRALPLSIAKLCAPAATALLAMSLLPQSESDAHRNSSPSPSPTRTHPARPYAFHPNIHTTPPTP